jgi:hypothetical protein
MHVSKSTEMMCLTRVSMPIRDRDLLTSSRDNSLRSVIGTDEVTARALATKSDSAMSGSGRHQLARNKTPTR